MTEPNFKCFADGGLFRLHGSASILPFSETDSPDNKKPRRRFSLTAYSGGVVVHPWDGPVVIDLDTLEFKQKLPTLFNHSQGRIVGFSDRTTRTNDGQLTVDGVLFAWKEDAQEIIDNAEAGFDWQVSVGLGWKASSFGEYLGENMSTTVNGKQVFGPCYIIRNAVLRENSFCVLGVDENTSVMVFATDLPEETKRGEFMEQKDKDNAATTQPDSVRIAELEKTAKLAIIDAAEARSGVTFSNETRTNLEKMDVDGLKTFSTALLESVATPGTKNSAEAPKKDFSKPDALENRKYKATPDHFSQTTPNDTGLKDNPPADDGPAGAASGLQMAVLEKAKKFAADDEKRRAAGHIRLV